MDRETLRWLLQDPEAPTLWRLWGQTDEDRRAIDEALGRIQAAPAPADEWGEPAPAATLNERPLADTWVRPEAA